MGLSIFTTAHITFLMWSGSRSWSLTVTKNEVHSLVARCIYLHKDTPSQPSFAITAAAVYKRTNSLHLHWYSH